MKYSNPISVIDDFLIEKIFEPTAHRIQKLTGITCLACAKFLLWVALTELAYTAIARYTEGVAVFVFSLVLATIIGFLFINLITLLDVIEGQIGKYITENTANTWRVSPFLIFMRVLLLIFFIYTISFKEPWKEVSEVISLIGDIAFLGAVYFLACTPLPPGRDKLSEWIEGFFQGKKAEI